MLDEFFDKTTTLFDRRFLLAWWYPTILSLSTGLLLFSWPKDWKPLNQFFSALQSGNFSSQLLNILGALIFTIVFAHLLQAFSNSFVQFWEGLWPKKLWNWYKNDVKRVNEKWYKLKDERKNAKIFNLDSYPSFHEQLFYEYPSQESRLLPTKLGNVLRAAEDYAYSTYGMHIVFWWPRIWLILPKPLKQQIDDSLTPMLALLNLSTQIAVTSFICSIYLFMQYSGPWKHWSFLAASMTLIMGIIVSNIAYKGAVSQAKIYGVLIRSTVDTYHFNLLKTLHQSTPSNLVIEKKLWNNLFTWMYLNEQNKVPLYMHDQDNP